MTDPSSWRLMLKDGVAAAKAGQKEQAQELLQEVLKSDPKNVTALAWLAFTSDELELKVVWLRRVLEADPNYAQGRTMLEKALLHLATEAAKVGQRTRARWYLQELTGLLPNSDQPWILLSSIAESAEESERCLKQALKSNPSSEKAQRLLEELAKKAKPAPPPPPPPPTPPPAASKAPPQPGPDDTPAPQGGMEKMEKSIVVLRKLHQAAPQNAQAKTALEANLMQSAMEAMRLGDTPKARAFLLEASTINPGNEQAWLLLASLTADPEESQRFLDEAQRATSASPQAAAPAPPKAEHGNAPSPASLLAQAATHATAAPLFPPSPSAQKPHLTPARPNPPPPPGARINLPPPIPTHVHPPLATHPPAASQTSVPTPPPPPAPASTPPPPPPAPASTPQTAPQPPAPASAPQPPPPAAQAAPPPAAQATAPPAPAAPAPKTRSGPLILVVDDSPTVLKSVALALEAQDFNVITAPNAMQALARLDEVKPKLVLTDITMPNMDGYQLCKVIKSGELTRDIPVLMLSGKDGLFDKLRGRMAGANGHIGKPFKNEQLIQAIKKHL